MAVVVPADAPFTYSVVVVAYRTTATCDQAPSTSGVGVIFAANVPSLTQRLSGMRSAMLVPPAVWKRDPCCAVGHTQHSTVKSPVKHVAGTAVTTIDEPAAKAVLAP